jgi:RNA polymerase sigma-70 factor (ECF subfamily)
VDTPSEAVASLEAAPERSDNLEAIFRAHYDRMARVIARIIRDPARAEELAVEVFLKWPAHAEGIGVSDEGWLYRTSVRAALDELRRQARRRRYEGMMRWFRREPTPEEIQVAGQEQDRVRTVLLAIRPREAEMLLLRSEGASYAQVAESLGLNPASIGTLLARAQHSFRKEYVKRYGEA